MSGFIGASAVVDHPPGLHHDHIVGVQGHADLVQHADHRGALGQEAMHLLQPVHLVRRVQIGQWFVHQHDGRIDRQGAGQQHPLALTARQLAQSALAPIPGLGGFQGRLDHLLVQHTGRRQPVLKRQAAQHDHIKHPQVVAGALALPQPGQLLPPLSPRDTGQGLAKPMHLALCRQQTRQSLEQGGFASAVGPHDAGPAASGQGQVHPVQHLLPTEANTQIKRLQGGDHDSPRTDEMRDMRHSK